jgi:hypothetical protein
MYLLPSEEAATRFAELQPSVVAGKTGRHTYTQWDSVLSHEGAAHPALNPFNLPQNQGLRKDYSAEMCATSLGILNRTIMVATSPLHTDPEIDDLIHNIDVAARVALEKMSAETAALRDVAPPISSSKSRAMFGRNAGLRPLLPRRPTDRQPIVTPSGLWHDGVT